MGIQIDAVDLVNGLQSTQSTLQSSCGDVCMTAIDLDQIHFVTPQASVALGHVVVDCVLHHPNSSQSLHGAKQPLLSSWLHVGKLLILKSQRSISRAT